MQNLVKIMLFLLCLIFVNFLWYGITHNEPYSLDYNVPLAKMILSGKFFNIISPDPYLYSPGASHIILALFMAFGIPLNLFGLLSWVILFFMCKKMGDVFGLTKIMSFFFSASVCTTLSVVRTISDQSIDKWLAIFFLANIILLERPKKDFKYYLLVGFVFGMLVGAKYSGPLFAFVLFLIYGFTFIKKIKLIYFVSFLIPFSLFGLFWYIRNFLLTGTPLYPANFPFLKGLEGFPQQDWMLWKIPFYYPQGLLDLSNSYLSEFMIWSLSPLVIIWYIKKTRLWNKNVDSKLHKVLILSFFAGLVCLALPIMPPYKIELFHIISDMRYVYNFVILLMLAVFLIADRLEKNQLIASLSIINTIAVFTYITYYPKLYTIVTLGFFLTYNKLKRFKVV